MFDGKSSESKKETAMLEDIEGVVSEQSLAAFIQWLYTRTVTLNVDFHKDPAGYVAAVIEFARLAEMLGVNGVGDQMAQRIKEIMLSNPYPIPKPGRRATYRHIYMVSSKHLLSPEHLPKRHPVRRMIAQASVDSFLRSTNYKFANGEHDCPKFATDLLVEVGEALNNLKYDMKPTDFQSSEPEAKITFKPW
jgi:hypothetical protein